MARTAEQQRRIGRRRPDPLQLQALPQREGVSQEGRRSVLPRGAQHLRAELEQGEIRDQPSDEPRVRTEASQGEGHDLDQRRQEEADRSHQTSGRYRQAHRHDDQQHAGPEEGDRSVGAVGRGHPQRPDVDVGETGDPPPNPPAKVSMLEDEIERDPNRLDTLPDEILVMVFSLLDMTRPADFRLLQVDRRFRRLCPASVKRLILRDSSNSSMSRTNVLLSLSPALTHLDLRNLYGSLGEFTSAAITIKALKCGLSLREIHGIKCMGSTEDFFEAISEFGHCLKHVGLKAADFRRVDASVVAKSFERLASIDIDCCVGVGDELLEAIGKHCKRLTKIHTSARGLGAKGGVDFLNSVKDRIQELKFGGSTRKFYEILGQCKKLYHLDLYYTNNLDRAGLLLIAKLHNLKYLRLYCARQLVSDDFISAFKERKLKRLEHLDLPFCNGLDDTVLKVIARNCPNLRCLDVSSCSKLTNVGIRQVLLNCGKMEKLSLRFLQNLSGMSLFQDVCLSRLIYLNLQHGAELNEDCKDVSCMELGLRRDKKNPDILLK